MKPKKISNVLLITPQGKITITSDGSRERKLAVPNLGLGYLAASLQNGGFGVEVLDVLIEGFDNEMTHGNTILYGLTDDAIRMRLQASDADLVAISCTISNRVFEVLSIARLAREVLPEALIILGGQHVTGMPETIQDSNVDFVLCGECDNSILQFIDAHNKGHDFSGVPGIVTKSGVSYSVNTNFDFPDISSLPFPAWDAFQLDKYWQAGVFDYEINESAGKRFLIMITSRGCPHRCEFCTSTMMSGPKYRQRPLNDVIAEIELHVQKYCLEKIHFWDDNFFCNRNRIKDLLRLLIERFPGIEFEVPSGSEVNAIDGEMLELMAAAGFKKIFLAVESPNAEIQSNMIDKNVNIARVPEVVRKARSLGLITEGSFMVGFPGETRAQIDNTFDTAAKFGFDRISISIVNPLPGTALYKKCIEDNLLYPDYDPRMIRWSAENIRLEVPRGYLARRRRDTWLEYMKSRIDIDRYESDRISSPIIRHSEIT